MGPHRRGRAVAPEQARSAHETGYDGDGGCDIGRPGVSVSLAIALALTASDPGAPRLCRTVHGRISAANGNPSIRIWVVGTKRMLGVGSQDDLSLNDLPAN